MEVLEVIKYYSSAEEVLGPKNNRYCSEGFKNVDFAFFDLKIDFRILKSKVKITFSKQWSSKNNENLKPHLGTTEYFNISLILSELLLTSYFDMDEIAISKSYVRYLKMKARRVFDNNLILDAIVNLIDTMEERGNTVTSTFDIVIGHMDIRLSIVHEISKPRNIISHDKLYDFINRVEYNFYKNGYKESTTDINNIELNVNNKTLLSNVKYSHTQSEYVGIGTDYKTMNISNFILMAGQLMQIMIYKLEGIRRDQSKNMWLRGLEMHHNPNSLHLPSKASVKCLRFNSVLLYGEKWRVADLLTSIDNLSAKFNMTHQII
ncbi:hypothetical protein A9168_12225 [Macellibacteroides sp. HH-ZS]|nr:hypothetical protein A9168_12225 [Macellibacteroides sp. HH-ZS]